MSTAEGQGIDTFGGGVSLSKPLQDKQKQQLCWDGLIQLNPSLAVSVLAFFKSGEKMPDIITWSELIQVKGRVRLENFENYIKQISCSRNRGLMNKNVEENEFSEGHLMVLANSELFLSGFPYRYESIGKKVVFWSRQRFLMSINAFFICGTGTGIQDGSMT
ncbi:hypothetical protein ACFE04_002441 [Oxalis oulophora]